MGQNAPNPFGRSHGTTIHYSVAVPGAVQIRILDAAGRLVRTIEQKAEPGDNFARWDGTDQGGRPVGSGVYFYQIKAGGFSAHKKMLFLE